MPVISLHRASRILEAVQKSTKAAEPKVSVKISIFAPNLATEIRSHQAAAMSSVDKIRKLLEIRRDIRSAVAVANAQCGISALLARKAELDDLISTLELMPGVLPPPKAEPEDEFAYRRRKPRVIPPAILDVETAMATAVALKNRYTAAEGAVAGEIEICTVDGEASAAFRKAVVEARRELDIVSEKLRGLNAQQASGIDVSSAHMDWLTANDVV